MGSTTIAHHEVWNGELYSHSTKSEHALGIKPKI